MVPKFATTSHGASPVLSNIYFASKLNPLFYFAIGSLLYVMEKCKILLKKTSFHVNVFLFLLHVTLQASTTKYGFDFHSTANKEYWLNFFIFYLRVFLLWVPIAVLGGNRPFSTRNIEGERWKQSVRHAEAIIGERGFGTFCCRLEWTVLAFSPAFQAKILGRLCIKPVYTDFSLSSLF